MTLPDEYGANRAEIIRVAELITQFFEDGPVALLPFVSKLTFKPRLRSAVTLSLSSSVLSTSNRKTSFFFIYVYHSTKSNFRCCRLWLD